jgi:hypothetical protein
MHTTMGCMKNPAKLPAGKPHTPEQYNLQWQISLLAFKASVFPTQPGRRLARPTIKALETATLLSWPHAQGATQCTWAWRGLQPAQLTM